MTHELNINNVCPDCNASHWEDVEPWDWLCSYICDHQPSWDVPRSDENGLDQSKQAVSVWIEEEKGKGKKEKKIADLL